MRKQLPRLYSQEKVKDPIVHVKFFTPWSNWTWYGLEFDGKDTFFGWVCGLEKEMGYFSLKELQSVTGPIGLRIERDIHFTPKPLSQVKSEHERYGSAQTSGPNPTQEAVLKSLGDYKIIEVHSDGDLTVQVGAHSYVVTTEGEVFVHKAPGTKVERVSTDAPAGARGEQRLDVGKQARARAPIIHHAITFDPESFELLPPEIDVTSAFPPGSESKLTKAEQAQVDRLIEAIPDVNDPTKINYWRDMGDKKVYLEGWGDVCLTGQGFTDITGGEWTEKIEFMVADADKVLVRKQEEKERPIDLKPLGPYNLIEGGFREFPAGERGFLYGATWGVYEKVTKPTAGESERENGKNNGNWPEGMEFNPLAEAIDLRKDYDEKARVNKGTLYRKGSVIQVWWDKWGKETWSGPDEKEAKRNFQAMKERWTELVSTQTFDQPEWNIKMTIAYTAGLKDAEEGKPNQKNNYQFRECYDQGYHHGKGWKYRGPPPSRVPQYSPRCGPRHRASTKGEMNYLPDSPEYLAETIDKTGWRERLEREFQLAIDRTRGG